MVITSKASLIKRLISGKIVLMRVSKPKANNKHLLECFSVSVMTFKVYVTAVMNKLTCFISQSRVRTAIRRGGQFCCSFLANLLQYLCETNYRNIISYCKEIKRVQFFWPYSVYHKMSLMKLLHACVKVKGHHFEHLLK